MQLKKTKIKQRTVEELEADICKMLTGCEYRWEKKEGTLYVYTDDNTVSIHLWDTFNPYIKRVYFISCHKSDEIKAAGVVGVSHLMAFANYRSLHTTAIQLTEDEICIRFEAGINNATDFICEFDRARRMIEESATFFFEHIGEVRMKFQNTSSESDGRIGFRTNSR